MRTLSWRAIGVVLLLALVTAAPPGTTHGQELATRRLFLPSMSSSHAAQPCQPIQGASYNTISVLPPPTDRPAEQHADLNLALRGYAPTTGALGLVDINGPTDPRAPQLPGLFANNRTGSFAAVYRVYDWNWSCNCRGNLLANPPVTLAQLQTSPGETIHVPESGYNIGTQPPGDAAWTGPAVIADTEQPNDGYEVLVLYASDSRITLKYTRNDNVVHGFTLHLEDLCVDPPLLSLYRQANAAGRGHLPALRAGQALGRASGGTIGVAIRDSGTFMDPRSRKDWWRGR